MSSRPIKLVLVLLTALLSAVALPTAARADIDPAGCTEGIRYDPTIPKWDQVFSAGDADGAITPFAAGAAGRSTGKNPTVVLDRYFDAVQAAVGTNPRVAVKKIAVGQSELGGRVGNDAQGRPFRRIDYWVVSTPQNIASFEQDGKFWADVRDGNVSQADGLAAARTRPALGWVTATPHGNEPAAGEAIARQLYELVARLDCTNARRLQNLDVILDPVRNPDGRDNNVRTTSWGFDPNRDFGVRNYKENSIFLPEIAKYPGLFFIDAHQQGSGYFFPPNEDPVHHEISSFSLDFIQNKIGPKLQQVFNDQSGAYQNYNSYDLFTPEYGDTVPSLLMGAAGMTYEKGSDEAYGKQVYDHYLAIDTTINLTSDNKVSLLQDWVKQWPEAIRQGQNCELQPNKLVSPLHETINSQPNVSVCGYFFRPGAHEGDVARLMQALREVDVKVFSLDQDVAATGIHEYGKPDVAGTLPKGTLYIPMAQAQKHWIQSILGEDPFIPYNYYYDVVTWSYGMQRGLSGDGFLTQQLPAGTTMSPVSTVSLGSTPAEASAVYAFDTDAMEGLALAVDLLDQGANVYRGTAAFTAGGRSYDSGAALVDADSLTAAGITPAELAALAAKRNTPITGLASFPVTHRRLVKPKIGLYTGGAVVPTNPLSLTEADKTAIRQGTANAAGNNTGQCVTNTTQSATPANPVLTPLGTPFCEALFVLTQKDDLPADMIVPVTSTDLEAGELVTDGFTALINPGGTIAAGAGATALQAFVNGGGRYLGYNAGGTTTARNAGVATLNTTTIAGLLTPGSTFDATFDVTNPVAWGFDRGGWIYRDATGNPVYDPATLGTGKAVVSYAAAPMRSYGYSVNALGTGQLGSRPAVVDTAFGQGRSILFGFNPFYRSWKEQDERLVLNAVLYPNTAVEQPTAPRGATAETVATARSVDPVGTPIAAAKLPAVTTRPLKARSTMDRNVVIKVARKDVRKLKAAVKAAKLRKGLRRKVTYRYAGATVRLVVRGARRGAEHDRAEWASRILRGLERRGVRVKLAQL